MVTVDTNQTSEIHTNDNENFITDHYKDAALDVQTVQRECKANTMQTIQPCQVLLLIQQSG